MKINLKTLTFIVVVISILLPSNASWSTETLDNILSKYNTRLLKMRMNEKTMRTLLSETTTQISEQCCENNFVDKKRLLEIKDNMEKCLSSEDKKCFKGYLVYVRKPEKIILLEQVNETKHLLLNNSRLKFDNLWKEETFTKEEIPNDYDKLKESYDALEKNNNKLKKRIEDMLKSYEVRILELEKANITLEEQYSKAYDMLPKYKKKRLAKEAEAK